LVESEELAIKNIKMIVTDLDRTLLRSDKTISDYTVQMLTCCHKRGIKVVFATARSKNRIDILPFMHLSDAMILNNGSVIYENDIPICRFGIPVVIAVPLMKMLAEIFAGNRISIEYGDVVYTNIDISDIGERDMYMGFDCLPETPADKIVIRANKCLFDKVCQHIPTELYAQLCENRLIHIMHKAATKWHAIEVLTTHFGITTNSVVAFGDDYNDVDMLRNCGIGVAVSNAVDEVKASADFVCTSNDDDGVAKWLEENKVCQT